MEGLTAFSRADPLGAIASGFHSIAQSSQVCHRASALLSSARLFDPRARNDHR
jgi:hypothetical protein